MPALAEKKAAEIAVNAGASGAILGLLKVPVEPLMELLLEASAPRASVVSWNHKAQPGLPAGSGPG
jgi:hypothetical protein